MVKSLPKVNVLLKQSLHVHNLSRSKSDGPKLSRFAKKPLLGRSGTGTTENNVPEKSGKFNLKHTNISLAMVEQSRAEQSRAEQSRAEQSRAEQSRAEQGGVHYCKP